MRKSVKTSSFYYIFSNFPAKFQSFGPNFSFIINKIMHLLSGDTVLLFFPQFSGNLLTFFHYQSVEILPQIYIPLFVYYLPLIACRDAVPCCIF